MDDKKYTSRVKRMIVSSRSEKGKKTKYKRESGDAGQLQDIKMIMMLNSQKQ